MRIVRVRAVIPLDDKCLFVQHAPGSTYWALPGGKLEEGETLEEGLRREIVEELGIAPRLGKLLYVQQFFKDGSESLEFFFEVTNGEEYKNIDLSMTTHGMQELSRVDFIDPAGEVVLPRFLKQLNNDIAAGNWPKVLVSD